jgi:hypothetical protein
VIWIDPTHAAVVDRTGTFVAGSACILGLENFDAVEIQVGLPETGRPKEDDRGNPEGRRDVSRSRVIADHEGGPPDQRLGFAQGEYSGEIDRALGHRVGDLPGQSGFRSSSHQRDSRAAPRERVADSRIGCGRPQLRGAERSPRRENHEQIALADGTLVQHGLDPRILGGRREEFELSSAFSATDSIHQAEHEALSGDEPSRSPFTGHCDAMMKQGSPDSPGIAHDPTHACKPLEHGRGVRLRYANPEIEAAPPPQFESLSEQGPGSEVLGMHGDDLVHMGTSRQQTFEVGPQLQADTRIGKPDT